MYLCLCVHSVRYALEAGSNRLITTHLKKLEEVAKSTAMIDVSLGVECSYIPPLTCL